MTPPTITKFTQTGNYTFEVVATDDIAVEQIDWYLDGVLLKSALNYTVSANNLAVGSHQIEVRVYDPAGLKNNLPDGRTAAYTNDFLLFVVK